MFKFTVPALCLCMLSLVACSDDKVQEPDGWTYYPEGERPVYDIEESYGHLSQDGDALIIKNDDYGDFSTFRIINPEVCGTLKEGNVMFGGRAEMVSSYTSTEPNVCGCGCNFEISLSVIKPVTGDIPDRMKRRLPKETWGGRLEITTQGGAAITSKEEYVNATFTLSHIYPDWNLGEVSGGIRGRGNSTWLWYPKKPYRIKFDKKQSILGLPKAKSWVLLAEYRDPTKLMNAFVFELGNLMELPYTNHNRYVEVVLNGKSQGLYHLTEQVQQNGNRVNIDEAEGILMQLDRDDGPELAPDATDNFWSAVYLMPVCVKNPDEPSASQLETVKETLRPLEDAIRAGNYTRVDELLDIRSMIDFLIVQELVYNVELDAPRSMYMHKDIGGDKWHMGPLWDFDAGFDFDWTNMTVSHNYFASYRELVLGTKPASHTGTQYRVPGFFSDLFRMPAFVGAYKARWAEVKPMVGQALELTEQFYMANGDMWYDDSKLWPIGKSYATEITRLKTWLNNRADYLDGIVAGY